MQFFGEALYKSQPTKYNDSISKINFYLFQLYNIAVPLGFSIHFRFWKTEIIRRNQCAGEWKVFSSNNSVLFSWLFYGICFEQCLVTFIFEFGVNIRLYSFHFNNFFIPKIKPFQSSNQLNNYLISYWIICSRRRQSLQECFRFNNWFCKMTSHSVNLIIMDIVFFLSSSSVHFRWCLVNFQFLLLS